MLRSKQNIHKKENKSHFLRYYFAYKSLFCQFQLKFNIDLSHKKTLLLKVVFLFQLFTKKQKMEATFSSGEY